jgi:hypothetical protein
MHTENAVEIRADLERILELATDVERWPAILPHYRWVRLLEGGGDRKVVEMAARRDRFPVRWRAVQEVERGGMTPVIRYRHVGGVTRGMEVAWTFERREQGYRVRIEHELRLAWPLIGGVVADRIIGPYFVAYIAGKTLATIKRIAEDEAAAHGGLAS